MTNSLDLQDPASFADTFRAYQRPIAIGAVVLAVAGGGFWMARRSGQIKETRAMQALAQAEAAYTSGGISGAQVEIQKILTRYSGTTAGTMASMLSAQWFYEVGQADSGLVSVRAGLGKAPATMRSGLLALEAAGLAMKGDHAGAAKSFEAAAAAAQLEEDKLGFQLEAARSYAAAGDTAAAERLLTAIVAKEGSAYAGEARVRLAEIKAKAS